MQDKGRETLELVEASRETEWKFPSYVGELFMGRFRPELLFPYPDSPPEEVTARKEHLERLRAFLDEHLDADAVDENEELPRSVIEGLRDLGFLGVKMPKEVGGLGLSQTTYGKVIEMVSSHCSSTGVWMSAHQSIGVPTPLKLFGTKEQKERFLPRLAAGELSAFALTEPEVGSDPGAMRTRAVPTEDGKAYRLDGEKLWCTNGPVADIMIVMAATPGKIVKGRERKQITAFIVEGDTEGIEVVHRCRFMGLKGISNGLLRFTNVRVPKENVLWEEGKGLKLALMTLNTGRLTLPAACTGGAKAALAIARRWANERVQWGLPIGRHEAISQKLYEMAADTFAMEAMTYCASGLSDRGDSDIRIEAAMAKLFCSEAGWRVVHHAMQVRGGRGYETASSLRRRGDQPWPMERIFRDMRINTIVEGASEIIRLFLAREALDPHMRLGGALIDPSSTLGAKLGSLLRSASFYALWYPRLIANLRPWRRFTEEGGPLARHLRFVERTSRKLARTIFHAMVRHGAALEKRQMLLGRLVDVGVELFAMSATIARAVSKEEDREGALELAEAFCQQARLRIDQSFRWHRKYADRAARDTAGALLEGRYAFLEDALLPSLRGSAEESAEPVSGEASRRASMSTISE